MTILFYNIRGVGALGRQQQICDIVIQEKVQILCLQETIREVISRKVMRTIGAGFSYDWNVKPACGHSGGLLIAVRSDDFEVMAHSQGDYFVSSVVRDKVSNLCWEVINVYGPVLHEKKDMFLAEISDKVLSASVPVILGGDFNIIRYEDEKNGGVIHRTLMYKFNYMINLLSLCELHRSGNKFTWTNKQKQPTMEVLDRVLVTQSWEALFPLSTVRSLIRAGSDHCPILVDLGGKQGLDN